MKKIIYTAVINDYDDHIPRKIPEGWEFRYYTNDKNLVGPSVYYVESDLSPVKFARQIKILPWLFFDFDYCVWIDGNTDFDPDQIDDLTFHDFVISRHPLRDCLYEEAGAVVARKKDSAEVIDPVVERYRREGVPEHVGMVASHAILRKNTAKNLNFCQMWWREVLRYSHRDQMSFNYVLWKFPIPIHYIKFRTLFWVLKIHRNKFVP